MDSDSSLLRISNSIAKNLQLVEIRENDEKELYAKKTDQINRHFDEMKQKALNDERVKHRENMAKICERRDSLTQKQKSIERLHMINFMKFDRYLHTFYEELMITGDTVCDVMHFRKLYLCYLDDNIYFHDEIGLSFNRKLSLSSRCKPIRFIGSHNFKIYLLIQTDCDDDERCSIDIYCYDFSHDCGQIVCAAYDEYIYNLSSCHYKEGFILAMDDNDGARHYDYFNANAKTFKPFSVNGLRNRYCTTVVTINDKLYLLNGNDNTIYIYTFDESINRWMIEYTIPTHYVCSFDAVSDNSKCLYILLRNEFYCWNSVTCKHKELDDDGTHTQKIRMVLFNNVIHTVDDQTFILKKYDIITNTWSECGHMGSGDMCVMVV